MQEEKPAVRTTIVGGRPPGSGTEPGKSPRGIEVLVRKAVVDPAFRTRLIERRSAVAAEIQLVLTPAEKTMLDGIPAAQLESVIARTKVHSKLVPILLTGTAAAILAAIGLYELGKTMREQFAAMAHAAGGVRPDKVLQQAMRANQEGNAAGMVSKGHQPDMPSGLRE